MNQISWSNTVIVAYSALPQLVKTIDFGVKSRIDSGFGSKHLRIGISTEELLLQIIQLNEDKRKLCNLKFIVDNALSTLKETDSEFIKLRYFKKMTFQAVADQTGVCIRTIFRRHIKAVKNFCKALDLLGFGENWLEKEYGQIDVLKAIKKRMEQTNYLTFGEL